MYTYIWITRCICEFQKIMKSIFFFVLFAHLSRAAQKRMYKYTHMTNICIMIRLDSVKNKHREEKHAWLWFYISSRTPQNSS